MNPPTDWTRVQRIMERSIRGEPPSDEERAFITSAWQADPTRYKALHATVKQAAHDEVNPARSPRST